MTPLSTFAGIRRPGAQGRFERNYPGQDLRRGEEYPRESKTNWNKVVQRYFTRNIPGFLLPLYSEVSARVLWATFSEPSN